MPTTTCGAEAARAQLPALIERAHHGESTVITRHGRPWAAIVPADAVPTAGRPGGVLALAGSGTGLWSGEPARRVAELRDEWR